MDMLRRLISRRIIIIIIIIINAETRTSDALYYHLCTAVHQNAAVFKIIWVFDHILLP